SGRAGRSLGARAVSRFRAPPGPGRGAGRARLRSVLASARVVVSDPLGRTTMATKPSYLGLLNAIANAECQAHAYLTAWAEVTPSDDVRNVLRTVAAREGEHGMTFAKRINELGFHVRTKDDPAFDKKMEIVRAECSDLEKMEHLQLQKLDTGDRPDIFDNFFKDHSIDIRTG